MTSGENSSKPPSSCSSRSCAAARESPLNMWPAYRRAISAIGRFFTFLAGIRLWSTLASRRSSSISPASHNSRRLFKHFIRTLLLAFFEGICRRRCSIVAAAVNANRARGEFSVTALYNLALIRKNLLPARPFGSGKMFFLQSTTSS